MAGVLPQDAESGGIKAACSPGLVSRVLLVIIEDSRVSPQPLPNQNLGREIILNNYVGVILMLSPSVSHKIYLLLILLRWLLPDKFLRVGKLIFKEKDQKNCENKEPPVLRGERQREKVRRARTP